MQAHFTGSHWRNKVKKQGVEKKSQGANQGKNQWALKTGVLIETEESARMAESL